MININNVFLVSTVLVETGVSSVKNRRNINHKKKPKHPAEMMIICQLRCPLVPYN